MVTVGFVWGCAFWGHYLFTDAGPHWYNIPFATTVVVGMTVAIITDIWLVHRAFDYLDRK